MTPATCSLESRTSACHVSATLLASECAIRYRSGPYEWMWDLTWRHQQVFQRGRFSSQSAIHFDGHGIPKQNEANDSLALKSTGQKETPARVDRDDDSCGTAVPWHSKCSFPWGGNH